MIHSIPTWMIIDVIPKVFEVATLPVETALWETEMLVGGNVKRERSELEVWQPRSNPSKIQEMWSFVNAFRAAGSVALAAPEGTTNVDKLMKLSIQALAGEDAEWQILPSEDEWSRYCGQIGIACMVDEKADRCTSTKSSTMIVAHATTLVGASAKAGCFMSRIR